MNDEGFREIQLNGKQLLFLGMAATVVLVVTFLFGVLTGRNAPRGAEMVEAAATEIAPAPALPAASGTADAPVSADPPATGVATKPVENLSYAERLLREGPANENLKPAQQPAPARETPSEPAPPVQEPVAAKPPAPRPAPATPESQKPESAKPEPVKLEPAKPAPAAPPAPVPAVAAETVAGTADQSGPGFAVQVAAFRDRRESDTLARQLIAKGYPAFVLDPVKGAPTALFRVRVGKYKTLKDAQAIMARLQNAEQFNTAWIAR